MSRPAIKLWYDILKGYSAQPNDSLEQSTHGVQLEVAQDVISYPYGELTVRPGFPKARSSAISGTPAITGFQYYGPDLADELVIWAADGKPYRNNANPPGNIAGGTDFSTGNTVLVRSDVGGPAGSEVGVFVSTSRNAPQQITKAMVRSDLGGTPPAGIDFKVWGRRPWMFSPSLAGTTYPQFASFGSADDAMATWANPVTINFLNFQNYGPKVLGGEVYLDHLWAFTNNHAMRIYQTPLATLPFAFQSPIFSELHGGPTNIHAVVKSNEALYWPTLGHDIKRMRGERIESIGYDVQPFLKTLVASRMTVIAGGWEPRLRLAVWAMTSTGSTHNVVLALQVDTGHYFIHTLSRNAFGTYTNSSKAWCLGGGYAGFFYHEYDDAATTGTADDSTGVIGGTLRFPRMQLGMPGVMKKITYFAVQMHRIDAETVTVQANLDNNTGFTDVNETAAITSGTIVTKYFTIPAPFDRIQVQVLDTTSGERFRLTKLGFPAPQATYVAVS